MLTFPLEARFSKILVTSLECGCTEEILTIISLLYVESVFFVPAIRNETFQDVTKKFKSSEGDHLTFLNVFRSYNAAKGNGEWCRENFVHRRNMEIAKDVRKQLFKIWERQGWRRPSCGLNTAQIRKCLLEGMQSNVAVLQTEGHYKSLSVPREKVWIHPSSCLFGSKPFAIVYTDLVTTTKNYMRNLSLIDMAWIKK